MAFEIGKTEHCGPKRGRGAFWGYRWDAKHQSSRVRRRDWRCVKQELTKPGRVVSPNGLTGRERCRPLKQKGGATQPTVRGGT